MISLTGEGLWESLLQIGIALVVIALITGFVVWRGRRRGSTTIALDATLTVTGWWLLLAVIGAVVLVVRTFAVDWAELPGAVVALDWPAALPCEELGEFGEATSPMLSCTGTSVSSVTVSHASLGVRVLAGVAALSTHLLWTVPAAVLAVVSFQTLRGLPFSTTVTRALVSGAIAVLVLGVASELLGSIAGTVGLREVFSPEDDWYPWGFQMTLTPLPFVGALGMLGLAAVFRQGTRLQLETERLQRETEGLV